jgi:hypothetical protein
MLRSVLNTPVSWDVSVSQRIVTKFPVFQCVSSTTLNSLAFSNTFPWATVIKAHRDYNSKG